MNASANALIAPCGMNCGICYAFLTRKTKCPGCRSEESVNKSKSCIDCKIRNCDKLKKSENGFCYDCESYPCDRIKHMDKRYRTRYGMSTIGNLENIQKLGVEKFMENEVRRWKCPACGSTICVHSGKCVECTTIKPQ